MQKYLKYAVVILLVAALVALFYNRVYIPKTTYKTVKPVYGDMHTEVFGVGNVGAKYTYNITAQTGGKITKILTDEGKWVKKGDLLVTIDSVDVPQLLEEAKILVKKAVSELTATQKEMASLQAQKVLAKITYIRYARLKEQSFASKAEYDKAKADLGVIDAQIEATKAHIESAKMEVERAKRNVKALKEKLSRYTIYAPVDGYVIDREAEVAQTVLPSQTILQIVSPKDVWVRTYIDESIAGNVKVGQKARIILRSQGERQFEGRVSHIVPKSDAVTEEREVDVTFEKLPEPFFINEQAKVSIASKHYTGVVKVPLRALSYYNGKSGVWVKESGKAHFIPLTIIARGSRFAAVKGIEEDRVILIESEKKKPLKEGSSVH